MDDIIKIENLRKVYNLGSEKVIALNCINSNIRRGEICCIVGTSGSGKSTLLNQLAGLEKPSKGRILIDGVNVTKLNERQLARFRQSNIGFIFQSYNLIPTLTALENVCMPLMFRGVSKRKREKAAKKMLAAVGLKSRLKHKPSEMSGGQQQRVGIARALVARPKIVFADEPTGNLDSKTTDEIMTMMFKLCRKYNQTLIIVTHDNEMARFADRIIRLKDGNIISDEEHTPSISLDDGEQAAPGVPPAEAPMSETSVRTGAENKNPDLPASTPSNAESGHDATAAPIK